MADAALVYTAQTGWHLQPSDDLVEVVDTIQSIRGAAMVYEAEPTPHLIQKGLSLLREGKSLQKAANAADLAPATLALAARTAGIPITNDEPKPNPSVMPPKRKEATPVDELVGKAVTLGGRPRTLAQKISADVLKLRELVQEAEARQKNAKRIAELEAELAQLKGAKAPKQAPKPADPNAPHILGPECETCGVQMTRPAGSIGRWPKSHKGGCPDTTEETA